MKALLTDVECISKTTYQRGLGVGFNRNDNMILERLMLSYKKSWIRGYILYINDEPVSYWIGSLFRETFYLEYTGYISIYEKYDVGTNLFIKMAEDIIMNTNCRVIDFCYGDAFYKNWFGDRKYQESSIIIFSTTIVNLYINTIMTFADIISKMIQNILKKFGVLNKVKKLWRNQKKLKGGIVSNK